MQKSTVYLKDQEWFCKGGEFSAPPCPHCCTCPQYLAYCMLSTSTYSLYIIEHFCHALLKQCLWLDSGYKMKSSFFSNHPGPIMTTCPSPLQPVQSYLFQTHPSEAISPNLLQPSSLNMSRLHLCPDQYLQKWEEKRWMQVLEVRAGGHCQQLHGGVQRRINGICYCPWSKSRKIYQQLWKIFFIIGSKHSNKAFHNQFCRGTAVLLGERFSARSFNQKFPSNHMYYLIYVLQAPNTVSVCIPPESDINTRIWVQVGDLRDDHRLVDEGGTWDREGKKAIWVRCAASYHCRQLDLVPLGNVETVHRTHAESGPSHGWRSCHIYPPTPVNHINSPAHLACSPHMTYQLWQPEKTFRQRAVGVGVGSWASTPGNWKCCRDMSSFLMHSPRFVHRHAYINLWSHVY